MVTKGEPNLECKSCGAKSYSASPQLYEGTACFKCGTPIERTDKKEKV